jgi:hypothetical protein
MRFALALAALSVLAGCTIRTPGPVRVGQAFLPAPVTKQEYERVDDAERWFAYQYRHYGVGIIRKTRNSVATP